MTLATYSIRTLAAVRASGPMRMTGIVPLAPATSPRPREPAARSALDQWIEDLAEQRFEVRRTAWRGPRRRGS